MGGRIAKRILAVIKSRGGLLFHASECHILQGETEIPGTPARLGGLFGNTVKRE